MYLEVYQWISQDQLINL